MILLIDAGNTRIKWRIITRTSSELIAEDACAHNQLASLQRVFADHTAIKRILGTNVASADTQHYIDQLAAMHALVPEWIIAAPQHGRLRNLYTQPEQLGPDRWAALIGAHSLHPHACLVVTAGTATTIDRLDASGAFLGGLILPGTELMKHALSSRTARLTHLQGDFSTTPRNTADAIHSGALLAQAGAIEKMFTEIAHAPHSQCLLSGGAAGPFSHLLNIPFKPINNLVLEGLTVISQTTAYPPPLSS